MAEEIDDNEFFQQDFTTASEWEIFNARLEEIFHEWKLPFCKLGKKLSQNELFLADWEVKSEIIYFANVELVVKRYRANLEQPEKGEVQDDSTMPQSQTHLDLMSLENNFCIFNEDSEKVHPLVRWYGLRDFVVIEPTGNPIINETQFRILLSSACICVAESNTEIPVFVQIMAHSLDVYLGVCESPSTRVNFDIIALETILPTCKYLSGLLCMFKAKIGLHYVEPVRVSVRLSFLLSDFISASYVSENRSIFALGSGDESDDLSEKQQKEGVLPFGVSIDPVKNLSLHCIWPQVPENVVIDSPTYSDFDPLLAPIWCIRASFKNQPIYFLTEMLSEYLKLNENSRTLANILGSGYDFAANQNLDNYNPLDLLTESKISTITSVLPTRGARSTETKKSRSNKNDGPLKDEELMQMLYYMFPDAQSAASHPYEDNDVEDQFDPLRIKSAAPDSLIFRLSILLATCNSYYGGLSALAHLWAEFTQEMRYRVERCIQIPGVGPGNPDSRTSLIHQKLQILNVCMERRRMREGGLPFSMTRNKGEKEDSEDEFFDCATDDDPDEATGVRYAPWNKPEGRSAKLGNLTLIDSPEPLYIPITQEHVPKTEDQLEDDTAVMLKLGPNSELRISLLNPLDEHVKKISAKLCQYYKQTHSQYRSIFLDLCAQMMSASLLSDMESFKAANPNGKLEDFIRWYSPRDWIEETDENGVVKGHLSQRMLLPGNTWQTVWSSAKPVPARKQKRLFDDTREAEKALHFFETRTIGQICQLTLSALFQSALLKLKEEICATSFKEDFNEDYEKLTMNLCKLSRQSWASPDSGTPHIAPSPKKWESLLVELCNLERAFFQANSLALKLFGVGDKLTKVQREMILTLLKEAQVELEDGAKNEISVRLLNLFAEAKIAANEFAMEGDMVNDTQQLPDPYRKEYTLRVDGRTVHKGVGGPQFLRAILDKHLRICGAFSENTTFF